MSTTKQAVKRGQGRPKETVAAEKIGPDYVTETPHDIQAAEAEWRKQEISAERNLAIVDKKFGDGLPYSFEQSIASIELNTHSIQKSMIEVGRHFLLIKEHESHGDFMAAVDRCGYKPRGVQRMMQAVLKLGNRPNIVALGKAKMLELLTEDDETLEGLEEGGTIANLKLDDMDRMTAPQLREALRKERQRRKDDAEVQERLLSSKEQKTNLLEKELEETKLRVKKWDGVVAEIGMNLVTMSGAAIMNINQLRAQIEHIQAESRKFDLSKQEMEAIVKPFADHISNLKGYLQELEHDFGLNLSVYMPDFGGDFIEHSED
ncbi:hypothetical protein [Pseudohongiella acticola]|uniref:hypothetical protein n=1 Tax=Pseudohongiella acticola TaxID=1524254 RepID=UPI0030EE4664